MTTVAPTTPVVVETPTDAATATAAPTTEPTAGAGDGVEAGRELFASNVCSACHGTDLSGGIGPALAGRTPEDLTEDRIRTQIAEGGNGMPVFPTLTPEQVDQLIALIRAS
jgi:cytochrome c550